jgi:integrase
MGKLEHFTVHDLRRTFRSLAASLGIAGNVAERCLNHKLKALRASTTDTITLKSAELLIKPWLM